jgi:hypothetical protein
MFFIARYKTAENLRRRLLRTLNESVLTIRIAALVLAYKLSISRPHYHCCRLYPSEVTAPEELTMFYPEAPVFRIVLPMCVLVLLNSPLL